MSALAVIHLTELSTMKRRRSRVFIATTGLPRVARERDEKCPWAILVWRDRVPVLTQWVQATSTTLSDRTFPE